MRLELIRTERGHARLDAAGAERDDEQSSEVEPRMQIGLVVLDRSSGKHALTDGVEDGYREDCSKATWVTCNAVKAVRVL